jgi:hypothetical protein
MSTSVKFQGEVLEFIGRMKKFEETTEVFQKDTNTRLTNIENGLSNPRFCGAHESLVSLLANQKSTNIGQTAENVEVQKQQGVQNKDIRDLQEGNRTLKVALSNRDLVKLVTTISAIIFPVVSLVIYIMETIFR